MPYIGLDDPPASSHGDQSSRQGELQVRLTAQRILAGHLRDPAYGGQRHGTLDPAAYWPEIDIIDLTGAYLMDFNLSGCHIRTLECNRTIFIDESLFRHLRCDLAFLQSAIFKGHTDFRGATFIHDAWFAYTTFDSDVWFRSDEFFPAARFGGHASFMNVTFTRKARFEKAVFERSADFRDITCTEGARAINLQGCQVHRPDPVNPDVTAAPSSWPPGWKIEPGMSGIPTLAWRD